MTRLAIIDHATHTLFIEDVSEEDLARYGGEEEAYIRDNYSFQGEFSWDYVASVQYIPEGEKTPVDADDLQDAFGSPEGDRDDIVEHIYKDNKILEYPDGRFLATKLVEDEVVSHECRSLDKARSFIDNL